MKSITIHGVDKETERLLKERAKSSGSSVNRVVKELLSKALGIGKDKQGHRSEFLDLFGVWKKKDEEEFMEAVRDFEAVLPEDWK